MRRCKCCRVSSVAGGESAVDCCACGGRTCALLDSLAWVAVVPGFEMLPGSVNKAAPVLAIGASSWSAFDSMGRSSIPAGGFITMYLLIVRPLSLQYAYQ